MNEGTYDIIDNLFPFFGSRNLIAHIIVNIHDIANQAIRLLP